MEHANTLEVNKLNSSKIKRQPRLTNNQPAQSRCEIPEIERINAIWEL